MACVRLYVMPSSAVPYAMNIDCTAASDAFSSGEFCNKQFEKNRQKKVDKT
jgi:hypothetical protein